MPLTAAQVVAQYGTAYRKGVITTADLIKPLYNRTAFNTFFTDMETDNTVLDKVNTYATGRFQRYQKAFLPLGGMTFEPNQIPLFNIMLEGSVYPDELKETALNFLVQKNLQRDQSPMMGIYVEAILDSAIDNMHRNETYKGVVAPIVAGTSSAEGALFNGVREQLRLAKINPFLDHKPHTIALGAVPTDPVLFVKYVETYYDMLPEEIKELTDFIMMSPLLLQRFKTGMDTLYADKYNRLGRAINFDTKMEQLYNRECTAVGTFDMTGSSKLWSTVRRNAVRAMKNSNNQTAWLITLKEGGKEVNFTKDFWMGYGFLNWDWVYDSDQN